MRSRTCAARQKTKLFWSWVNYLWLHLHSSEGGYHFFAACQGCFNCTQLPIHTACPSTSQLLFWNFFWKFFERYLFTLRHLQSFVVAFIEQVQNIEKSKASLVEVVSCFATVKARIQERQADVQYISSQVKLALRKFSESKDHDCDSFMSEFRVSSDINNFYYPDNGYIRIFGI